jgi:hypothetical protein
MNTSDLRVKVIHKSNDSCYTVYLHKIDYDIIKIPIKEFFYKENKEDQEKAWQDCLNYATFVESQIKC